MTTTEYLNQAYLLETQIDSKLEQLQALRSTAERVTVSYGGERVSHSRTNSLDDVILKIMDSEEEISRKIAELLDKKNEIAKTIGQVKNAEYRIVLEKRYLCYHSIGDIAKEIGHSRRWVYTIHDRAVAAVGEVMKEK